MKILFLYLFFLPLGLFRISDSPSDFEGKLSSIASDFREKIMNEDDCKDLMYEASRVVDDIDDELKKEDYSVVEIRQFKEVRKKAKALESYISAVGVVGLSTNYPTIEEFNLANGFVGGSVTYELQGKFCIDFISVSVDNYKVYLGLNNSNSNYTVSYYLKAPEMYSGKGTMGLSSKSVRPIYDNREEPNQKTITIYNVTCAPI